MGFGAGAGGVQGALSQMALQMALAAGAGPPANWKMPGAMGTQQLGGGGGGVGPGTGHEPWHGGQTGPVQTQAKPWELNATPYDTRVQGRTSRAGPMYLAPNPERGAPSGAASAALPYTSVPSQYRRAAEEALEQQQIPAAYRDRVRAYFESLQRPQQQPLPPKK